MKVMRKKFDSSTAFPFQFIYKDNKPAQSELPDHFHDWYEIVYIRSGTGTFFIDQTVYLAAPGDLFLIPGNTIHRSQPTASDPKASSVIYFAPALVQSPSLGDTYSFLQVFDEARRTGHYRIQLGTDNRAQLLDLLTRIHTEQQAALSGYRHAIRLLVQQILLLLDRSSSSASMPPASPVPAWMQPGLAYLDAHPSEPISLAFLANQAAVTPAHYSRVFKKLTGIGVTDYITTKRIIHAKDLLSSTSTSIAQVAEQCGFESLPHFHRTFKRLTGLTPAAYRKKG